jgi:hypothetical protein
MEFQLDAIVTTAETVGDAESSPVERITRRTEKISTTVLGNVT